MFPNNGKGKATEVRPTFQGSSALGMGWRALRQPAGSGSPENPAVPLRALASSFPPHPTPPLPPLLPSLYLSPSTPLAPFLPSSVPSELCFPYHGAHAGLSPCLCTPGLGSETFRQANGRCLGSGVWGWEVGGQDREEASLLGFRMNQLVSPSAVTSPGRTPENLSHLIHVPDCPGRSCWCPQDHSFPG